MKFRKSFKAFSLIEILAVLAIFAVIAAIVLFAGSRMLQAFEYSQFMNELRMATARMQTEAQTDLVERVILFQEKDYVLAKQSGSLQELISKTNYPPSVKKISGLQIGFSQSGAPSKSGTIVFKDGRGLERKLVVAPVTGRVRIE